MHLQYLPLRDRVCARPCGGQRGIAFIGGCRCLRVRALLRINRHGRVVYSHSFGLIVWNCSPDVVHRTDVAASLCSVFPRGWAENICRLRRVHVSWLCHMVATARYVFKHSRSGRVSQFGAVAVSRRRGCLRRRHQRPPAGASTFAMSGCYK